jgi:hypothetical protein
MDRKALLVLCGSSVLAGVLSACSFGGGDETTVQTKTTTTGQELIELSWPSTNTKLRTKERADDRKR